MIIDGHQHVMLPSSMQIRKMDAAGVDKTVLFTTIPHIERAENATLDAIKTEMQVLYRLLASSYSTEERQRQMGNAILELKQAILYAPKRFYGFGPVPLGLDDCETAEWVSKFIIGNAFRGIGEFTPGSEAQISQLEPVFRALTNYRPFGEPLLCRQLIEYVSPSVEVTEMALGGNIAQILQI